MHLFKSLTTTDGLIKTMEVDSGQVISSIHLHSGWITDYFYW